MPSTNLNANFPGTSNAQTAIISFATAADQTVIAGAAGKTIRILKLAFVSAGTTNITLKHGTTAWSGVMPFVANMGFVEDAETNPFITLAGEAFVITSSAAVQVSGYVKYTQD
jgi:hypothetical protein